MHLEDILNTKNDFNDLYKKLGFQIQTKIDTNDNEKQTIEPFESFLAQQKREKNNNKIQKHILGEKAIKDFMTQVEYYQKHQLCFGIIDATNIYVINNNIFFVDNRDLQPIVDKYYISINEIYSRENPYLPPELIKNTELPFKTRYTQCFYSLGKIVQTLIFKIPNPTYEQMKIVLGDSPLYFCINRAIKENPNHRYLIYI